MPALNASDLTTPHPTSSSLLHDALYQQMRAGLLDHTIHREAADRILQSPRREDGMRALHAWWVYQGVRLFANPASDPAQQRPVFWAPGGVVKGEIMGRKTVDGFPIHCGSKR